MLQVKDINKSFDGLKVLKGISLNVEKGDVVAILGPSGSGKTTLLRCLNFLEKADTGTMTFEGKDYDLSSISKNDIQAIRMRTGFVFQNYNLFRNRTALGNVTEGLTAARHIPKLQAQEMALQALEKVGLSEKKDAYPHELSGGQQQRVAIARAMAANPDIIYFDEPTSALDPELIGEVLEVMRKLAQEGMTMVVVTHELHFAKTVSNQVIFMEDGNVIENSPTKKFFENPSSPRALTFLRNISEEK